MHGVAPQMCRSSSPPIVRRRSRGSLPRLHLLRRAGSIHRSLARTVSAASRPLVGRRAGGPASSATPTGRRLPTSISRTSRDDRVAALFGLFAQDDAGMRVHVMYLMTYRTSHRLIDVVVFRGIFGNKALNAVSAVWAPVHKERHAGIAQRRGAGGRDLNRVVRLGQDRPPRCARTPVCHP